MLELKRTDLHVGLIFSDKAIQEVITYHKKINSEAMLHHTESVWPLDDQAWEEQIFNYLTYQIPDITVDEEEICLRITFTIFARYLELLDQN